MASPESAAIRAMLLTVKNAQPADTIEEQRANMEVMSDSTNMPAEAQVAPTTVAGLHAEWVSMPDAVIDRAVLLLHGGAYSIGSCRTHREMAARVSAASGVRVLVIEYRLAPEHPFPAAIEDATAAYRALLEDYPPERLVIMGDSAGGGLTVATLLSLRDAGDPLPAAGVLLSPWLDLEGVGESAITRAEIDPWITIPRLSASGQVYLNGADPHHPLAAPVYADLRGLPPLLIHVGDHEVLLDDSTRLATNAKAAGVDVTLDIWPEMWHVWHAFAAYLPEGRAAIEQVGIFIRQHINQEAAVSV